MDRGFFGDSDDQIFVDDAALQRDYLARGGGRGGGPSLNTAYGSSSKKKTSEEEPMTYAKFCAIEKDRRLSVLLLIVNAVIIIVGYVLCRLDSEVASFFGGLMVLAGLLMVAFVTPKALDTCHPRVMVIAEYKFETTASEEEKRLRAKHDPFYRDSHNIRIDDDLSNGGGPSIDGDKRAAGETIPTKSGEPGLPEKKRKWIFAGAVIILLAVLLPVCVYGVTKCIAAAKQNALLKEAQVMMEQGLYSDAEAYLKENGNYSERRTNTLINLCRAHTFYNKGNLSSAYSYVDDIPSKDFQKLLPQAERDFCNKVMHEYRESKYAKEKEKSYDMPYIGMWEGFINNSLLGKPGKVKTNQYHMNRVSHVEKTYTFYKNGTIIYVVKCLDGRVSEISDLRYRLDSSGSSSGHSSGYSGSSSGSLVPSPDTKYFVDPEDFYDYYYDDFLDYEEAEDYYYSHGGR